MKWGGIRVERQQYHRGVVTAREIPGGPQLFYPLQPARKSGEVCTRAGGVLGGWRGDGRGREKGADTKESSVGVIPKLC